MRKKWGEKRNGQATNQKRIRKQHKFTAANQGKRQKVEYSSIKRKPKSLVNNICMFLFVKKRGVFTVQI
jgi:hypothetical protein